VPEGPGTSRDRGATEALRDAIQSTLSTAGGQARAGSAALRPERATRLLDEVARRGLRARDEAARRGQEARDELARRSQEAGAELTRRGHQARGEVGARFGALLSELEERLRKPKPKAKD
jgi:hypothetical protein